MRAAIDRAEAQTAPAELDEVASVRNALGAQAAALELLKQDLAKLAIVAAELDRNRHDDAFRRSLAKYPVITSYLGR
ncbi:hypothetical protein [Chelatococcus reniformis]|uniref:Uncharacterized protein n=1 Tax=Chelatococcus reniformis TaxID=1494448 RepID=A0A916U3T7_9HYPH|nr:hypothetical protein [Chelatococcus reniformis]GGC57818.1 hypothetical protein GCM10010994_16020 [Chelatococcus reniformis]